MITGLTKTKYNLDDIEIGDKVYFVVPHIPSYNAYWTVRYKTDSQLMIEWQTGFRKQKAIISPEEVYILQKVVNKKAC